MKTILNYLIGNYAKILPYVIILILGYFTYMFYNKTINLNDRIEYNSKITAALNDTVKYYKNVYGEVVAEKKTIQIELTEIKKYNNILTDLQKELFNRVKELEKKYDVIVAGIIETNVSLNDLKDTNPTINDSTSISFTMKNNEYDYNIIVGNVKPIPKFKPYLLFDKFELINKQVVDFHWNKEPKEGYPVSFSVTNSNRLFTTSNIDSYAIPEINKQEIKPTFWKKVSKTLKEGGGNLFYVGIGVGAALLLK